MQYINVALRFTVDITRHELMVSKIHLMLLCRLCITFQQSMQLHIPGCNRTLALRVPAGLSPTKILHTSRLYNNLQQGLVQGQGLVQ